MHVDIETILLLLMQAGKKSRYTYIFIKTKQRQIILKFLDFMKGMFLNIGPKKNTKRQALAWRLLLTG